jgi:hypothetical protein
LILLNDLIGDLGEDAIRHIKMAMIIIFVYRAMPSVGASLQWWQIDVLGLTINLALNHIPAKAIAPPIADNLAKNDSSKPSTSICHHCKDAPTWIGGELADVFKDEREVVFMIALFIPLLSILGVSLVRLNPVPISKLSTHCICHHILHHKTNNSNHAGKNINTLFRKLRNN